MNITTRGDGSQQAESCHRDSKDQRSIAAPLTKTETASEGGLDPTVESIEVVHKQYHAHRWVSNGLGFVSHVATW